MRTLVCAIAFLLAGCSSHRASTDPSDSTSRLAGGYPLTEATTAGCTPDPTATAAKAKLPEPGPEDGGLRLRLSVAPRQANPGTAEGYDVRLDLVNCSPRPITLRAGWRNERDAGDVKAYLEAATGIECVPEVAPWIGGVQAGLRQSPQPELDLAAGETISVRWQTEARQLKNLVTDPNEVQNPRFPFPGLYSVHATLDVITTEGAVRLRSNEQLVPVGGSPAMPKFTRGLLLNVDGKKTAMLGLGSLHRVQAGDQFEIGNPKGMHWKLTITDVMPEYSVGTLQLLTRSTYPPFSEPPLPNMPATLVRQK
jgi:hypothetical protein